MKNKVILVIDMMKDTFNKEDSSLATEGLAILPTLNEFLLCVLATELDALSHDFGTIIIEDCCAAADKKAHQAIVNTYRKTSLYPFLRVMNSQEFLAQVYRDFN